MNRKVLILAVIFTFSFIACGRDMKGVYVPQKPNLVKCIEFKDGKFRFTDSIFGIKQGFYDYELKGDTVYLNDPGKGSVPFKIVDSKTLKCDYQLLSGVYKKK